MIARTMTGAVVAAALVAPIAASAHNMRFPHLHSQGYNMSSRVNLQADLATRCMNGTAPVQVCARWGY